MLHNLWMQLLDIKTINLSGLLEMVGNYPLVAIFLGSTVNVQMSV